MPLQTFNQEDYVYNAGLFNGIIVEYPLQPMVSGRPLSRHAEADPILLVRPTGAPVRALLDAVEIEERRLRM